MASKAVKVARAKFDKLASLNDDVDAGGHIGMSARKAKGALNDRWFNRKSNNVAGCKSLEFLELLRWIWTQL